MSKEAVEVLRYEMKKYEDAGLCPELQGALKEALLALERLDRLERWFKEKEKECTSDLVYKDGSKHPKWNMEEEFYLLKEVREVLEK